MSHQHASTKTRDPGRAGARNSMRFSGGKRCVDGRVPEGEGWLQGRKERRGSRREDDNRSRPRNLSFTLLHHSFGQHCVALKIGPEEWETAANAFKGMRQKRMKACCMKVGHQRGLRPLMEWPE
eukprot:752888-Hanusia_phi.AAC.2